MIKLKEVLDNRICDIEKDAGNTQTYRQYIIQTENEFGLESLDLDTMSNKKLEKYLDFLDELWIK